MSDKLRPDSHGKVRDIYDCGDELLMVASDRISAFDVILPDEIPYKGEVLTRISAFWFERFKDLIPNHMLSVLPNKIPAAFASYAEYLSGRAMLVKKAKTIPIECIVRGYLTGSGKKLQSFPKRSLHPRLRRSWESTMRTSRLRDVPRL